MHPNFFVRKLFNKIESFRRSYRCRRSSSDRLVFIFRYRIEPDSDLSVPYRNRLRLFGIVSKSIPISISASLLSFSCRPGDQGGKHLSAHTHKNKTKNISCEMEGFVDTHTYICKLCVILRGASYLLFVRLRKY